MAGRAFRQELGHTLQPTALLNEVWLKVGGSLENVRDRHHFFAIAARAMRQVLADHARGRGRAKRGAGIRPMALVDDEPEERSSKPDELLALGEALDRLENLNPRHARVVELRVFGSFTIAEAAEELGISRSTVELDWSMARAWLRRELAG